MCGRAFDARPQMTAPGMLYFFSFKRGVIFTVAARAPALIMGLR